MVTRQSKKIGDPPTAANKLFLSSENSRRDSGFLHISSVDSSMQSTVVTTRRSTRFSNSSNSVKVRLFETTGNFTAMLTAEIKLVRLGFRSPDSWDVIVVCFSYSVCKLLVSCNLNIVIEVKYIQSSTLVIIGYAIRHLQLLVLIG